MTTKSPLSTIQAFVSRHPAALMAGAAILIALALYGPALSLPIYHDDALLMRTIKDLSLAQLFTLKGDLTYYRPIALAPWLILYKTTGSFSPALIHGYNFGLFVWCGWMSGLLARRFAPASPIIAWGTMLVFLVFPFSYQAVTWGSALVHLQPLAGLLAALWLVEQWWDRRRWPMLMLAWLVLALAMFTHENGVILPILLAGWLVWVTLRGDVPAIRGEWRRLALALIPVFVLSGLYVAIWYSLTHGSAKTPHLQFADIGWNAVYLTQGIAYPVAQLGGALTRAGLAPVAAAALLDGVGIAVLAWLALREPDRRLWIVPVWYVVSILPATLFLSSDYAVDGPRLMTTASFGAALGWAVAFSHVLERSQGVRRVIPAALGILLLAGGGWFVWGRMLMERQMGPLYWSVIQQADPNGTTVVVNLPAWIAARDQVYALGSEGIAYLPNYFPLRDLIWANSGASPHIHPAAWQEIAPEIPADVIGFANDSRQVDAAGELYAIQHNDRVLIVRSVGGHFALETNQRTDSIGGDSTRFADSIGLSAGADYVPAQALIKLRLAWEVSRPDDLTPYVHVYCNDSIVAQADGAAVGGVYPFREWLPGEKWRETRLIGLPAGISLACLRVRIGLYHPESGQRVLLLNGEDGLTIPINAR